VWRYNGIDWKRSTAPRGVFDGPGHQIAKAIVADEHGLVAVGYDTSSGLMRAVAWTSPDGLEWTKSNLDPPSAEEPQEATNVIVLDGGFLAVGSVGGYGVRDGAVWASTDGLHWTRLPDQTLAGPGSQLVKGIVVHRGLLVGVGESGDPESQDAAVWIGAPD
jgi:hypothetical protein